MRLLDPRLVRRARAVRLTIAVDSLLGIVAALLVLAQAVLLAHGVARAFDGATLADVSPSLVALVGVSLARAAALWGFAVVGRRAAGAVMSQLRLDLVARRLRDQPAALDGVESAEVATAGVAGVDALELLFAAYLPQLVLAVLVPLSVLILVAAIDPLSAALMLITLPLVAVFMWLIGVAAGRRARARWQTMAVLATHFLDVVRGLPTLRAFNRAEAQVEAIDRTADAYRRTTMGTLRLAFLSGAVLELAATISVALVAVVVGVRLAEGRIAFEPALTVLVLAPELYLPIRALAARFHASADGAAVATRLLDLTVESTPWLKGTLEPPSPRVAALRLDGVSYRYPTGPAPVLERVDLELAPGETVALVGPSGGGKSTIASLILRLCEPAGGRITIGGIDLAACDSAAWRARLAWVPQEPTLFRGTLADNIRLGDPEAGEQCVVEAATLAGAHTFIDELPDRYGTLVGEGGRQLSTGERQRVALARAFLRDADLVVLDEPTANLDRVSAALVGEAIDRLRVGRTVLLVAHSPELAARADRVVRVDEGRVAALPVAA